LNENLSFWAQDKGCLHVRGELYMATGFLDKYTSDIAPCEDKCCQCTGEWSEHFLPVNREEVVSFLQSEEVGKKLPLLAKDDNLTDILWKAPVEIRDAIFGMKGVKKTQCDCLFMQLVASNLIKLDGRPEGPTWIITRTRDKDRSYVFHQNFLDPRRWVGFNFLNN